jgi:hypothetical protein
MPEQPESALPPPERPAPPPSELSAPPEPPSRRAQRPPSDYRPDLRPMLILGGLLLGVIVGWIILSPIILPR